MSVGLLASHHSSSKLVMGSGTGHSHDSRMRESSSASASKCDGWAGTTHEGVKQQQDELCTWCEKGCCSGRIRAKANASDLVVF